MGDLGVALIGAGMVAGTHLAAIRDAGGVRLTGVWSRAAARAEAAGQGARVYATLSEVAADPAVDVAIVVTPPNARRDVLAPLVAAGKHILLEKPVARDLAEARAVVALCRDAGVTLGVVFQHRMRAASLKAAAIIAAGDLGAPGLVEIAVPWWRDQSYYDEPGRGTYARDGGGVLISQAIHTLDLALSLAGPVTHVQAMTATTALHRMEAEDVAAAGLRFASGAVGTLTATTASFPGAAEWIRLHYARASLHLEAGVLTVSHRDGRVERFGEQAGTGGGADPMAFTHGWHQAILEDFRDALRDGRPPAVPGADALAVHALIDAITRSARAGQTVEVTT
ncbi:Gfo/Idh/MocA family protein [Roseicyclus persicicus]|uniref:Gfo/Idh/MocA family oxidoreductase n=1 Tax=Roseicyclus persicicus TaxID=2650661 RepID=A0A7X6K0D4_9RHOB|nr:Gfo/Idh/MocA family oxidoreductase [Roseibacterium persicicum]NKX45733.1 Gfo/Idh/MocA family oxidoreductase [Roseibacterium persicicum]